MPSVCDTLLSNHQNPEPIRSDSNLSNHDSRMAGCDNFLSSDQDVRFLKSRITVYANLVAVFWQIGIIKNYVYVSHFCAYYQTLGSTDDSALRIQRDCTIQLDLSNPSMPKSV